MLINYLPQRAWAVGVVGLLVTALTLAACGGTAESVPEEASSTEEVNAVTPTVVEEEAEATEEAEIAQAPTATEETQVAQPQNSPPASCEPVLIPDNELIAAPTEDDWARGLATASVTVIEYGDFQ
jgi:hypothetical protein